MVLELKIENFLSFKNEATYSFEATKDKSFEDYQVVEVTPNVRILRLGVVYGANASGKSNLLKSFQFLRNFWLNIPENKDENTGAIPFVLNNQSSGLPSKFTLIFYIGSQKYTYSLDVTGTKVISEKLYVYPGVQPALLFERKLANNISDISFNPKKLKVSQAAKDEINVKCLANMSVFAAYNQVNVNIPEIENVISWIKTQFLNMVSPEANLIDYAEKAIIKDSSIKEYVLNFLNKADYNISDIDTEISERSSSEEIIFEHKIDNQGELEFFKMPKSYQSDGTLRTFGLATIINQAIKNNAFLPIDEIESSLHPKLVEFVIENFLKQSSTAQLLLTTHYDGLLEEDDLLRKDSIWFTSKKEDASTELYSLTDFNGINRIGSLQKAYKYGKFGAIPNI